MKTITRIVSAALFSTFLMSGVVSTSALSLPFYGNNNNKNTVAQNCENNKAKDLANAKNNLSASQK